MGVLVPGEKQSQLLDLSLGLDLEFDNNHQKKFYVPARDVGTVVPTMIAVPTKVVGTAETIARTVVPTMIVGTDVPIMIVGTAVPTIIVLTAYYWKSCLWLGRWFEFFKNV